MRSRGRLIAAVITMLVLAGTAIGGVVLAQTPSTSPTPTPGQSPGATGQKSQRAAMAQQVMDDFLNQLALNLKIDRPTLDAALKTTAKGEVAKQVAAGTLTQNQANQINQQIDSGKFEFPGGFRARGERGKDVAACAKSGKEAIASALHLSPDALSQALKSGQSIDSIAKANGTTQQDFQNAVTTAVTNCVNQQVAAGNLTQQQATEITQRLQQRNFLGHERRGGQKPTATPASN